MGREGQRPRGDKTGRGTEAGPGRASQEVRDQRQLGRGDVTEQEVQGQVRLERRNRTVREQGGPGRGDRAGWAAPGGPVRARDLPAAPFAPHRSAPTSEVLDDQLPGAARAPRFGRATGQRRRLGEAVGAAHETRDAALPRALVRHGWAGRRPAPRRLAPPPALRPGRARPAPPPPVGLRP